MVGPVGVGTVDEDVEVTLVALVRVAELLTDEEEDSTDELIVVEDADVTL